MQFSRLLKYLHEIYPDSTFSISIRMLVEPEDKDVDFTYYFHHNDECWRFNDYFKMSAFIFDNFIKKSGPNPNITKLFTSIMRGNI